MKRIVLLLNLMLISPILANRHNTTHRSLRGNRCPICLGSSFTANNIVTSATAPFACHHPACRYHAHCLNRWIQQRRDEHHPITCPLCRAGLAENTEQDNCFYIRDEDLTTTSLLSIGVIGALLTLSHIIVAIGMA